MAPGETESFPISSSPPEIPLVAAPPAANRAARPFTYRYPVFTLRLQFNPRQDPAEVTAQLMALVDSAPVDEVTFFYFAEEQNNGHETLEQIQTWIDATRPCRDALKERGVAISLNPWHTLLHWDSGRRLKPGQSWQTMVDPGGCAAQAMVCPLDADWQAYFLEALKRYAREDISVLWIDDDIRYHNHAPLQWGGCFCPQHVAEFNRRVGSAAGREEIVRACLAPGKPHPWRGQWMDMWQETLLGFLEKCRVVIEAGGAKMGLMSSLLEAHSAEGRHWADWWKTFGGGNVPVHRPHFWGYSDVPGAYLIRSIAILDQNRSIQPAEIESGPEIENFPYGCWNKSYRQTFAQMAVAEIFGSTSLNISLFDFMGNRLDEDPTRAAFLKRIRPNMTFLADTFPSDLRSAGVGVPWSEDLGRRIHLPENAAWGDLQVASRGWAHWLGAAGMAFSTHPQEKVNALAGASVWGFDDEQIRSFLSKGLLLDGEAARILTERGFDVWIGVQSAHMVTQNDLLYSIESGASDSATLLPHCSQISVNQKPHTRLMFQAQRMAGVRPISQLFDPLHNSVGHGAFTFENELGGRIAVVPWDAGTSEVPMMDLHRAKQLRDIVRWLARDSATGAVEGGAWLIPQFLTLSPNEKEKSTWRGAVWNGSPDEIESFTVHCPDEMPAIQSAWHLSPRGERIPAEVRGNQIILTRPMHQWEVVIF